MPEFAFTARDAAGHNVDGVMTAADKRRGALRAGRTVALRGERAGENDGRSLLPPQRRSKTPRWPPTWPNSPTCCKMACPCSKHEFVGRAGDLGLAAGSAPGHPQKRGRGHLARPGLRPPSASLRRAGREHGARGHGGGVPGRRLAADGRLPRFAGGAERPARRRDDLSGLPGRRGDRGHGGPGGVFRAQVLHPVRAAGASGQGLPGAPSCCWP